MFDYYYINIDWRNDMSQQKKRAIFTFLIWGSIMAAFSAIFFLWGGPERYVLEKWRHVAGAVIIAGGYMLYLIMNFLTRTRPGGEVGRDERDEGIRNRANSIAFVVVLVYVFALAIFLWERYQGVGFVPAGWMWFLAYSTSFAAFISSSVIALILESKASGYGQS
jgi:hypothetical protein